MVGIYLLCLIAFPLTILYKVEMLHQSKTHVLMSKNDTQFLRGVSACFVVMAHFCIWINEMVGGINKFFYFTISQLGGIGVLVFFFVSGYGIYESYADKAPSWDYLWKRAKSVYFPYLITKFLLVILEYVIGWRVNFRIHELVSILLVEDWFVHVILMQYITFFVIWKFLNIKRVICYSLLFDSVLSYVYIVEGKPERWFNALWLFSFGMVCSQYENKICNFLKRRTWMKSFLFFVAFCIMGILFAVNKGTNWANPFKVIGGCFLCLVICSILCKFIFKSKLMLYMGKRSMYLYIVHINMWSLIRVDNYVIKLWIVLVLSMLLSEVIYKLTEFLMRNRVHIVEMH